MDSGRASWLDWNLQGIKRKWTGMCRRLRFERLEDRHFLTADIWIGGNGNWNQSANWSNGLPTGTSDVTINTASAATIAIQPGEADSANSLTIGVNNTLSLPGGGDPSNPTANLIAGNADFESPTASGSTTRPATWGYWGSSYLSRQYAFSGSQSMVVGGSNSGVSQTFTVTPGASYTASVYAMSAATNPLTGNINAELQVLFFDSTGTQISSYSPPNQIVVLNGSSATGGPLAGNVGGGGWNHFFTTAVGPSNAATAHVQLATYSGGGTFGGAVYFDGIKFGPAAIGHSQLTTGSLTNNGAIVVGPTDSITDSGGFIQSASGMLDIQLGGKPSTGIYGSMAISGAASLAGAFKGELMYGYAPSSTDTLSPITFASETGTFSSYTLPGGASYQFASAPSFTNVLLSAAPAAAVSTTVNAANVLHSVSPNMIGINSVWWDSNDVSSQTQQMTTAAGIKLYRFPGGSSSDQYHFNVSNNFNDTVAITTPQFGQFTAQAGGSGIITLDYGSGSPQEAAAELAYLQGSPSDTAVIGNGIEWMGSDTTGQWQTVNWNTVGYWASLRAATPLAQNDGLNFLRIKHPAAFTAIKYWEVGNEEYGSWEVDHHGTAGPGGASTGAQHDPATYVAFAQQFAALAAPITANAGLPAVSIGIDSGDPTGGGDKNWTKNVLAAGLAVGFVPNFISDHSYMQGPGNESDSFLLNNTVSYAPSILDWSTRCAAYQSLLQQTVGSQAASVQLMATEFNSVYSDPGKQSTSLVNGLFVANSLGSMLISGYVGSTMWDLRNGWDTTKNNSPKLYGWRNGGDYGALGSGSSAPATGSYVAYPNYFAFQLLSKIATAGGQVVAASTSYSDLNVYAVTQSNGDLALLVINTNPATAITDQFSIAGFQPSGAAQLWQYGKTQDTAQSQTVNGASSLVNLNTTLTMNGSSFSYSFPAYSMTVLDLKVTPVATSINVSLTSSNLATNGTQQFAATALDQFGNLMSPQPSYNWLATGGQISTSGLFSPPYTSGTATIQASTGGITGSVIVTLPGAASWSAMAPGSWNAGGNWQSTALGGNLASPGLRGVPGDTVLFQSETGATASLNGVSPTLAGITFNNSAMSYTIAPGSGGALLLNNSYNIATIQIIAGDHSIQSGISLLSNLAIDTAANSSLSISGAISGGSQSLTKTGAGTLTLTGANTFTGGTSVFGGSLIVQTGAFLGGSLAIGNVAIVTIAASDANGNPLESAAAPQSAETAISVASISAAPNPNPPPSHSPTPALAAMALPSTLPADFRSLPTASATAELAFKKLPQFASTIAAPPDASHARHQGRHVIQKDPQINTD
jgi:autotransporter-associated beta strand protein